MEQSDVPCTICGLRQQDEIQYGEWLTKSDISVHYFCLLLSTNLLQWGGESAGIRRFQLRDIRSFAKNIIDNLCDYCHKPRASVFCHHSGCSRKFHLICGIDQDCLLQFCNSFDVYCKEHYPPDVVDAVDDYGNQQQLCKICMEAMPSFHVVHTIASCCNRGWYHVNCLRRFARSAGYYFGCLNCRRKDYYREKVRSLGVYVPDQEATWENKQNYALLKLYLKCNATPCTTKTKSNTIITCKLCGAYGMHKKCARKQFNDPKMDEFECDQCQAITGKRLQETTDADMTVANDTLVDDDEECNNTLNKAFWMDEDSNEELDNSRYQATVTAPTVVADALMVAAVALMVAADAPIAATVEPVAAAVNQTAVADAMMAVAVELAATATVPQTVAANMDVISLSSETDSEELMERLNAPPSQQPVAVQSPFPPGTSQADRERLTRLRLWDSQEEFQRFRIIHLLNR